MDRVDKISKKSYTKGGAIALLVILLISFFFLPSSDEKFNKELWQGSITDKTSSTCYRGGMAKDIVKNSLSAELKKRDVISLLGNPDTDIGAGEILYILGMCSGFGFDHDALHIYFKESGEFSHARIYQH